jgi:hypothetical protein
MKHLPIPIESYHTAGMEAHKVWRGERDGACNRERRQLSADLFFRSPFCILKANPVYVKCCALLCNHTRGVEDLMQSKSRAIGGKNTKSTISPISQTSIC